MTNEEQDKLVDKLRKLKAKADDPNISEAEAALYAGKVAQLLQQHNLSEAALEVNEHREEVTEERVESSKAHDPWAQGLAQAVARLYFCSILIIKVGSQKTNFIFIGKPHNIEVAKSMTMYLIKAIGRLAVTYANSPEAKSDWQWTFTRARNGFERGAGERMRRRINEMYTEQTKAQPQRAATGNPANLPALYEDELGLTKAFIKAMANVRALRGRCSDTSGNHAARGYHAAGGISLNGQVGGTSTKMIK